MGTYRQCKGNKGSLKWIQKLINERPGLLEARLRQHFAIPADATFRWASPLAEEEFAEYSDGDFLRAIGREELKAQLSAFWPQGGPHWDALGELSDGTALLVEAKAHISELISHLKATAPASIRQIKEAMSRTRAELGVQTDNPWDTPFYQYANRIAHLHFLKNICRTQALLIFVDFTGDEEVGGPVEGSEWVGATSLIHAYLGIRRTSLMKSIAHISINVAELE